MRDFYAQAIVIYTPSEFRAWRVGVDRIRRLWVSSAERNMIKFTVVNEDEESLVVVHSAEYTLEAKPEEAG